MRNIRIIRNRIRCNHCGTIIESESVHDFKMCPCQKVYIDGGNHYLRRGFTVSKDDYTEMSVVEEHDNDIDSRKA